MVGAYHPPVRENLQAGSSPPRGYHLLEYISNKSGEGSLLQPDGEDSQGNDTSQPVTTHPMNRSREEYCECSSDDHSDGTDEAKGKLGHLQYVDIVALLLNTGTKRVTHEM